MLIIGLTGGIGSGKSTVARCFSDLGIPVIDADRVARELVAPGEPALEAIRARFGDTVISERGELDRNRLRTLIFSDPQAKADLEAILHPGIRSRMWAMARAQTAPYVILEIPLLIETGQHRSVDRVLVVDAPEAVRIERIQQRDNVPRQEALAAIRSQISAEKRLEAADDVIDNSGPVNDLKTEVATLNTRYLQLSSQISA